MNIKDLKGRQLLASFALKLIDVALRIELTQEQCKCIAFDIPMPGERQNGKTLVHMIKLCLSEGEPLNLDNPISFCDNDCGISNTRYYANGFYLRTFLETWHSLDSIKVFKMRPLIKNNLTL